jgi:hypothetical protein
VKEDGPREYECADEEKHQGIGERGEDLLCRGDLKDDACGGAEQCRHGKRKRFGHPEYHNGAQHRGQTVSGTWNFCKRENQQQQKDSGGKHRPDALAHSAPSRQEGVLGSRPRQMYYREN